MIPKADSFWTFLAEVACGSRVVSGSASARTTSRLRGATQKKCVLRPVEFPMSGARLTPTAPEGLRLVAYGSESGRAP